MQKRVRKVTSSTTQRTKKKKIFVVGEKDLFWDLLEFVMQKKSVKTVDCLLLEKKKGKPTLEAENRGKKGSRNKERRRKKTVQGEDEEEEELVVQGEGEEEEEKEKEKEEEKEKEKEEEEEKEEE